MKKIRTIVIILRSVFSMMVMMMKMMESRGSGGRCAGSMKSHVRKNHFRVFKKDHF